MSSGRNIALWIVIIAIIPVSACATGATTNSSAQGTVRISLSTEPDPSQVGDGKLIIRVAEAAGQPIDNLKVDVLMDMTSMCMGPQVGLAEAQGKGVYVFAVIFHCQGEYKVQLWVRRNSDLLKNEEIKFQVGE